MHDKLKEMNERLKRGEEPIEIVDPIALGYKDRCMKKWQGFILSDHVELMRKREKEMKKENVEKDKQDEVEISSKLAEAYMTKTPVVIQADVLRNGLYYDDLYCMVLGYHENEIHFELKDGRRTKTTLDQIRNVEFMDILDWYAPEE